MRDITLDHYLTATEGHVLATGIQALIRLPLEQARFDLARGLNTGGFISGYRGSPLGRYDMDLKASAQFLDPVHVVVLPAINEELAATAIWGTQQVNFMPGAKYDGVFGIWYGKAPGVDRAIDPIRHGNFAGTAPIGGVVMLIGDDPECKSSTLPSQSEYALVHAEIPILNPSNVQECLDFGMMGIALSRYSGCWTALMATSDNMDSHAIIDVGIDRYKHFPVRDQANLPPLYLHPGDTPMAQEARLRTLKLPAVIEFARKVGLNKRIIDSDKRRLGVITTGRAVGEVLQALKDLGLDHAQAADLGLSVLKVDMPWPLDVEGVRDFARGLEEVIVIEDKRPLLEGFVKEALYDLDADVRPRISGKRDTAGNILLPDIAIISTAAIVKIILDRLPPNTVCLADTKFNTNAGPVTPAKENRDPFFCSGCPHSRSTRVVEGSVALTGIGCHHLIRFMPNRTFETEFFSQMGGEGVQWVGQAPFTDMPHVFANIGDGTYVHSGSLAIRQAVAAKANMTYKILFNGAVAMTGGQAHDAELDIPTLTHQLAAEGVVRIAIVAEDPSRHESATNLASGVTIYPRAELQQVERSFREIEGVTVIIYDQMCATEKRRMRKRGLLAEPNARPFINELVCEGCGDCTVKSKCLSVEPIETELGRKRRINQSSCNKDYSCTEGFCPSFVTVTGGKRRRFEAEHLLATLLPEPPRASLDRAHNILISGIGGLGVTTLAGIISMAAHLEDRNVRTLNQPGLAQKGGGVASHIRISARGEELVTPSVPLAEADVHLASDMIVAGKVGLRERSSFHRTATIINTGLHPTSVFLSDTNKPYDNAALMQGIRDNSRVAENLDANALSETVMGTELFGNMIMLGYALQKGWLPLSIESLDKAIVLNGAAAAQNRRALDLGRLAAAYPEKAAALMDSGERSLSPPVAKDLEGVIAEREAYLTAYQSKSYAKRYSALVAMTRGVEEARVPGSLKLTEAVARGAFAAMLIKDEYEVARLLTLPAFRKQIDGQFSGDYEISYNLAPSWLARTNPLTGEPRKMNFGEWLTPALKFAARLKFLRGTPVDPFNFDPLRRQERRLRDDYVARIPALLTELTAANHAVAVEIAALPLDIRGYGHIKERARVGAEKKLEALWTRFQSVTPPTAYSATALQPAG
jgi:indolepyruvate ferredoxin oxidoreductase